jgi:hypothetical protein
MFQGKANYTSLWTRSMNAEFLRMPYATVT